MRWSVGIEAEGDRPMRLEEIVELADAVATSGGIASGIGTPRYGAQLVVEADTREQALAAGRIAFADAVRRAGLPEHPIVREAATSEAEDADPDFDLAPDRNAGAE
ncbi:MAG: hypothetical protein ACT4RN_08250 [Pseudonocardia sp.]